MSSELTPRPWEGKDDAGRLVHPARVQRVHLPWLPQHPEAQALIVAAAQIDALLAAGTPPADAQASCDRERRESQRTTEQNLCRLREGLLGLLPPTALGLTPQVDTVDSLASAYLRNLMAVIPLWEELFVSTTLRAQVAFDVVIGCRIGPDLDFVLWSPFQLPQGWVRYSTVPVGPADAALLPAGRAWSDRPRVGVCDVP